MAACARARNAEFQTERLAQFIRGNHMEVQEKVNKYVLSKPELQTPVEISMDAHRELFMRQLLGLVREAGIRPFRYAFQDPEKYLAMLEAVGCVDMSLGIKMGVHYRCPNKNAQASVKVICDLYALDRIWNDIGTHHNVDYMAPNTTKLNHKLTEYLCFQVRNIAGEVVDAFDLLDLVMRSPIVMQSSAYSQYKVPGFLEVVHQG